MTEKMEGKGQLDLHALVVARFEQSMSIPETFFANETGRIAEACWAMARRFHQGGRLLAFGNGAWATDAQHVSVEFVHPVIVGKRALPALALTNDSATLSVLMAGGNAQMPFMRQLQVLARPQDMAMGFSPAVNSTNVVAALVLVFFFSSRRRHTRSTRDWSSDVCSSDLRPTGRAARSGRGSASSAAGRASR